MKKKIFIRKNVIILMGAAYATLILFFVVMVKWGGVSAKEAFDSLNSALMALIGGSLAISKDLISADDDPPPVATPATPATTTTPPTPTTTPATTTTPEPGS